MLKSFTTLEKSKIDSIAIGGFDGVHLAHQVLISKLGNHGALLIVHRGGVGLTPDDERCLYHDKKCMILEFDKIKEIEAEAFVHYITLEFVNLQKIVVGYDFHFGKKRKGNVSLLKSLFFGEVEVVDEIFHEGISVHSRKIKEFLSLGAIVKANALLGREYAIKGDVISGQGLGKKELYPTLNLFCGEFFLPLEGVYVTKVKIGNVIYPSVTFIGKRLSTDAAFSIETHILDQDFSEEVARVELFFVAYLRENRKFEDLRDLKVQISHDIKAAKAML